MTEGNKLDAGKDRWDLIPYDALQEIVKVMSYGANKYSDRNWENGISHMRLFSACMRHLTAWLKGQDKDPETGLSHLAHASCCILFVLAFKLRDNRGEDRPGSPLAASGLACQVLPGRPEDDRPEPAEPFKELSIQEFGEKLLPHKPMREDARPSDAFKALTLAAKPIELNASPLVWNIDDIPYDVRFRFSVVPASKTAVNLDGAPDRKPYFGADILIYIDGMFQWRKVRSEADTMDGTKYNVAQIEGSTSILMVPASHVFAVRTDTYIAYGAGERAVNVIRK